MRDLVIPPTRDADWWEAVCVEALLQFAEERGAILWPEAEAVLCESRWVHERVFSNFPDSYGLDPMHLGSAREYLRRYGYLIPEVAELGGHPITAYQYGPSMIRYGRATAVRDQASAKRRLYRRFITWTGRAALCGGHAEKVVQAAMDPLKGSALWVPKRARIGLVRTMLGRKVEVGDSLDAHGFWANDPDDPSAGVTPFAVEVKNLRSRIYPWDNEMWDLLSKLAAFPDVVPVLVARRLHPMAFNMFKDIGALGVQFTDQLFSPAINPADFVRVCGGLSLHNARQVGVDTPMPLLSTFFGDTGPRRGLPSLERWSRVAPIAHGFEELRDPALKPRERRRLWTRFAEAVQAAGMYERKGWAPRDTSGRDRYVDYAELEDEHDDGSRDLRDDIDLADLSF